VALGAWVTPGATPSARLREFWIGSHGPAGYLWLIAVWAVAIEAHVMVHELGHAFAGVLADYRILALDCGLLHVRLHQRLRVEWQHDGRFFLGGLTRAVPRRPSTPGRQAALVLGGPLASLLGGATLVLVAGEGGLLPWLRTLLYLQAAVALVLGAVALIPRTTTRYGLASDGQLLLSILRGERASGPPPWVQLLLMEASLGVRLRDSEVAVEQARAGAEAIGLADGGTALVLAAVRALDSPRPQDARPLLEQGLAALEKGGLAQAVDVLHLATAYFALVEPDLPRARDLSARLAAAGREPEYHLLTAAAVAHAEGRSAESAQALEEWLAWVSRAEFPRFRYAGNEWIVERLPGGDFTRSRHLPR
jgi:hypothetical protein